MAFKNILRFFSSSKPNIPDPQFGRIGSQRDYIRNQMLQAAMGVSTADIKLSDAPKIISTIHTCIKLISENISKRKLFIQQDNGTSKIVLNNHPLSYPLGFNPSTYQSDTAWVQNILTSLLIDGNAYVLNTGDNNFQIVAPKSVQMKFIEGELWYDIPDYLPQPVLWNKVLHFKMPVTSADGVRALSPLKAVEAEVNLAFKGVKTVDNFYANNAQTTKFLVPIPQQGAVTNPKLNEYVDNFQKNSGFQNAGKVQVVPPQFDIKDFDLDVSSIQFLEACKYTTGMIAALYGVPSHLIFGGEQVGKYEEQALAFKNNLDSYSKIITDELTFKLLSKQEKINGIAIAMTEPSETNLIDKANAYKTLSNCGAVTPRQIANAFNIETDPNNKALDKHYLQGANWAIEDGPNPFIKSGSTGNSDNSDKSNNN